MKHVLKAVFSCLIFFSLCGALSAGSLQDDYKEIEEKRASLEKQRNQYANQLKALNLRQHHLTLSLYKCVSQKPDRAWEQILNDSKAASDNLEKQRQDVVKVRIELEQKREEFERKRLEIEQKHRIKTEGSDYEKDFRSYISDLTDQYFNRLENELFKIYASYFSDIEKYLSFLEESVKVCKR